MGTTEQIEELARKVQHLEYEMTILKQAMGISNDVVLNAHSQNVPVRNNIEQAARAYTETHQEPVYRQEPVPVKHESRKNKSNIENKIGKNLMGILASILIFVSFILFAGMFYKYIPDTMKVVLMFMISGTITLFGIIKMAKASKYNILFSSLAGCGTGALYITCMVTYFGFHMINEIVLTIMLFIWMVFMLAMSKYKSVMFSYICNIGLIVATILSAIQWEDAPFGVFIYFVMLTSLYAVNKSRFKSDFIYFVQVPVVMLILNAIYESQIIGFAFFVISIIELTFVYVQYGKDDNDTNPVLHLILNVELFFSILFNCTYTMDCAYYLYQLGSYEQYYVFSDIMGNLFCIATIAFSVLYYKNYKNKLSFVFYTWYSLTLIISAFIFTGTFIGGYIGFLPFFVTALIIGRAVDDVYIRCSGYCMSFFSLLNLPYVYDSPIKSYDLKFYVVSAGFFLLACIFVYIIHKGITIFDKYFMTFVTVSYLIAVWCKSNVFLRHHEFPEISNSILFLSLTVISVFMNTKYYRNDCMTGKCEKSSKIIGYIFNGFLMIFVLTNIGCSKDSTFDFVIYTLSALALFCINAKHIFEDNFNKFAAGIYNCLKFSILIFVILDRCETESYIMSIAGIIIAMTCIILGIRKNAKSFRIYGLILTMICICKLILIDVHYDTDILRPLGFFVAGILCFGISWIYSRLEKQINSDNNSSTS